ncbi:hypothetical protein IC575_030061 [Cucumis melo]
MLDGQLCLLHHREIVKINQMTMNLEISCYIVKEYLVICQMSMEVTIWMRICQHMYDQTVKAHGFLNNTLWDILFTHGANDSTRRSRQGGWWSRD